MIEYSLYELEALSPLNSFSPAGLKKGMYLRVKKGEGYGYSDYFPHVELGDVSVEELLQGKRDEHFEKALWWAENELEVSQRITPSPFKNHNLYRGDEVSNDVLKLKVTSIQDFEKIVRIVKECKALRLDANGTINVKQWNNFLIKLNDDERSKIEYIEDPGEGDWSELLVPSAKDFMDSPKFDFVVYKPNARFLSSNSKAIFSSYMGSDLGRYHAWLDLMDKGDLNLVHGLHTPNIYRDQKELFVKKSGAFEINIKVIDEIYLELRQRSWCCLN